jgi:hypothetical protein
MPLLVSTTALATISTASVIGIVSVVIVRPAWCPDALCPPLVIEPNGTYDSNLVVAFSAVQGSTFLLSADPAQYTSKNLPPVRGSRVVVAQRTADSADTTPVNPYRLKISVRNRKSTDPTMLIERVSMVVDSVGPQPSPTNVLLQPGQDEDLQGNAYSIVYRGEPSGAAIAAQYNGKRLGHVRLGPQELDYLTLTFSGTMSGYIRFRIRIDYRLTTESQPRTLTLDEVFTTVFVDPHGWQPYQLANDRLLPA